MPRDRHRIEELRAKAKQLWKLAAADAQGDHVEAVAHVYHDITAIIDELEADYRGLPEAQRYAVAPNK